jgi:predicted Ser/Thr protein kinase
LFCRRHSGRLFRLSVSAIFSICLLALGRQVIYPDHQEKGLFKGLLMNVSTPEITAAVEELGGVKLPENVELLEVIGQGSRSIVFKARYRGEIVALKIYRPAVIQKFRKKYDVNIAVFEMSQNRQFRKVPDLLPFSAKPIMVLGHDGKQSLCFIQEYVDAIPLTELAAEKGEVPQSVLEAGEVIARAGEQAGLDNLDLDYRNILVREQAGRWLPVLHDFNQPPAEPDSGKSFMGLFKKETKPGYEQVREWIRFSEKCGG